EKLALQFHKYWKCTPYNSAQWRKLIATEAPNLIDHGSLLLAVKNKKGIPRLYFHTDTHWTPFGAALGFRQLLKAIFPRAQVDAGTMKVSGTFNRKAELANIMLLLQDEEPVDDIEDGIASVVRDEAKTIFMIDSFYDLFLTRQIKQVFPNSEDYNFNAFSWDAE